MSYSEARPILRSQQLGQLWIGNAAEMQETTPTLLSAVQHSSRSQPLAVAISRKAQVMVVLVPDALWQSVEALEAEVVILVEADVKDKEVCAICCGVKAECSSSWSRLRCGHAFHAHCMRSWLNEGRHSSCPLCRDNLAVRQKQFLLHPNFDEVEADFQARAALHDWFSEVAEQVREEHKALSAEIKLGSRSLGKAGAESPEGDSQANAEDDIHGQADLALACSSEAVVLDPCHGDPQPGGSSDLNDSGELLAETSADQAEDEDEEEEIDDGNMSYYVGESLA